MLVLLMYWYQVWVWVWVCIHTHVCFIFRISQAANMLVTLRFS
jgi:hypothetical protein